MIHGAETAEGCPSHPARGRGAENSLVGAGMALILRWRTADRQMTSSEVSQTPASVLNRGFPGDRKRLNTFSVITGLVPQVGFTRLASLKGRN
jgi:hypothetical protein